jgi:hypothetical protein
VKTSPAAIAGVLGPSPATGTQVVLDVVAARPAEPVKSSLQVTLDLGADKRWRFRAAESAADDGATDDPSVQLI